MRQKGKCLADQDYSYNFAAIYRAVLANVTEFKPMDYVTLSKKWAIEHCQHLVATEEQPCHVMYLMVPTKHVFDAYNPGEYFYDGPTIPAKRIVYKLSPDQMESFKTWLEVHHQVDEDTIKRIYEKITTVGMPVNRGERTKSILPNKSYASDPGDFGRGVYTTTNYYRAKCYGPVKKTIIKLQNPLILTDREAYVLADKFRTLTLAGAQAMTDHMLSKGYDGLVSIRVGGKWGELEIVDYRPYATSTSN